MRINGISGLVLRNWFLTFGLVFILIFQALSQMPLLGTPRVKTFSRSDYQAGTQNWSIGQNRSGLMYFGNNKRYPL